MGICTGLSPNDKLLGLLSMDLYYSIGPLARVIFPWHRIVGYIILEKPQESAQLLYRQQEILINGPKGGSNRLSVEPVVLFFSKKKLQKSSDKEAKGKGRQFKGKMVKLFSADSVFGHPWALFTKAVWQKYPNPFASHVLASDVIERRVDPETGILHTTRLFLKQGKVPKWGAAVRFSEIVVYQQRRGHLTRRMAKQIMPSTEAFIIEHSQVDPRNGTMTTVTKNLSHSKIMLVEETQTYKLDPLDPGRTLVKTEARIVSNTGWFLRGRIEGFGLSRFKKNWAKSTQGILHVVEQLQQRKGKSPDLSP
jgi:4-amino-4-deoxychorismate lyase